MCTATSSPNYALVFSGEIVEVSRKTGYMQGIRRTDEQMSWSQWIRPTLPDTAQVVLDF
jgi:hypothetical protein